VLARIRAGVRSTTLRLTQHNRPEVIEMRVFLTAVTTFLFGTLLIVGLSVGLYFAVRTPATSTHVATKTTTHMSGGMSMTRASMMTSSSLATQKITIQHVQRGCHVWSNGRMTGAMMRLHLRPGQKLSIMDNDVDPHQMMELAGPIHLQMGGPMMMNHGETIAFMKKGVYRLGTKTVEMPGGGEMEVKTVGPDNHLRLLVTVA
jgi:hypothetical protein